MQTAVRSFGAGSFRLSGSYLSVMNLNHIILRREPFMSPYTEGMSVQSPSKLTSAVIARSAPWRSPAPWKRSACTVRGDGQQQVQPYAIVLPIMTETVQQSPHGHITANRTCSVRDMFASSGPRMATRPAMVAGSVSRISLHMRKGHPEHMQKGHCEVPQLMSRP